MFKSIISNAIRTKLFHNENKVIQLKYEKVKTKCFPSFEKGIKKKKKINNYNNN